MNTPQDPEAYDETNPLNAANSANFRYDTIKRDEALVERLRDHEAILLQAGELGAEISEPLERVRKELAYYAGTKGPGGIEGHLDIIRSAREDDMERAAELLTPKALRDLGRTALGSELPEET